MLLEGHPVAKKIYDEIKATIASGTWSRPPCLAAVLTTKNAASQSYVNRKVKACKEVGIDSQVFHIEPSNTEELLHFIDTLNASSAIDGILIQLPLPPRIHLLEVLNRIDPTKDVDGFHPLNAGKVLLQDPTAFYPCTPLGIKELLLHYNIETSGRHVVILGRSNIVGKPLATLLMQEGHGCNATVTVAHSRSRHLRNICMTADILVTAIGKPLHIGPDMVPENCTVVDVGINKIEDSTVQSGFRIVGDVDFHAVRPKCHAITPVPGGVGPMTIAMLLKNTLKSFFLRHGPP
jgi:methylenetetrahydrofolate dehydrogenase (NADP+)/methenyltetrahydrofolate cyclohydrolase